MRLRSFLLASLTTLMLAGCATAPQGATPAPVQLATITGSEEKSMLLDNFTVFITAVDGRPVAGGRENWNKPVTIPAGHRKLAVEFRRGTFHAGTDVEVEAMPDASYQVRFKTDAQLFGHNSYCDFWITDLATGQSVTAVTKAAVMKIN